MRVGVGLGTGPRGVTGLLAAFGPVEGIYPLPGFDRGPGSILGLLAHHSAGYRTDCGGSRIGSGGAIPGGA